MAPQNYKQAGNGDELELSRLLKNSSQGRATSDFRDRMRDEFLRNCGLVSESRECKPERSSQPEMAKLEDNMRSVLEMPTADSAYRAELRQRFIDFANVADRESRLARSTEAEKRPRGKLFRLSVLAAAAAAALFVAFYLPSESQWRVENPEALDGVLVDGRGFDSSDHKELVASLARGAHLETGPRDLNLDLDSGLRIRVLAGTSIQFHGLPEAGSLQEIGFVVQGGEIFLETSASFAGNPIRIETADVEVMVTGTALGVMVNEQGTCTCVEHGQVEVMQFAASDKKLESVKGGHLLFVMRNGECLRSGFDDPDHDQEHSSALAGFAELR